MFSCYYSVITIANLFTVDGREIMDKCMDKLGVYFKVAFSNIHTFSGPWQIARLELAKDPRKLYIE